MTAERDPASRHTPSLVPQTAAARATALALVALTYYASARLGLGLSLVDANVTPLWPPTGVAVAAMLVLGRRMWPAVALAALAVNVPISETVLAAAVTAVGNTLAPYLAVVLLDRVDFRRDLGRLRDALAIIFVGALAAMLVSATVGAATLAAAGTITLRELPTAWTVWWTGDAMGVLVVAPFLLSLPLSVELEPWPLRRWLEAALFLLATTAIIGWSAQSRLPLLFLVLPVVGWAAWRLQLRGAAPAALTASLVATWAAVRDLGPFAGFSVLEQMATLQAFNVCVALASFVFAALVSERREEARELADAAAQLEERVQQRTLQLSTANARLVQEMRERSQAQEQLTAEEARSRREHEIAETLQRSLLPDRIAELPGVDIAARYVPATSDVQVGGDWYDVIPLPDGLVGLAIGDVAGHGLHAAATMVQVRVALRAYALQDPAPASVMSGVHQLVSQLRVPEMVTLLYLVHDPSTGSLRFSNAGHPPALVVHDGESTYLTGGLAPPLGVTSEAIFSEATSDLAPGATLLLYTDGLVERRGEPITQGLAHLADEVVDSVRSAPEQDLETLCDHVLGAMIDARQVADDVALVALRPTVRADGSLVLRLPAEARMLVQVRGAVRRWLRESGIADDDAAEILVACGEACANAVQHAYSDATAPGPLAVEAHIVDGTLELQVRDQGRWRAPVDRGGGWGLQLMQGLMDDVDVEHGATGTTVRLRRDVAIDARP
ncbi:serine phosphatase RsbU (regulator of sigma subunit) [Humibacillus xanthopallidus]|uniref:protein-serine/threonine phosphatase n=1 Tax=Humibacillus xanthopallidus TaxID=412689 RepID=A0A543PN63_9MICO|nr:SpoIIE family protein phosphatase [Humibacillus xanthopallidus]TQN45526.1 serine phosphatase RsbU (regulator of sigma subunit) [Humibacillus xanthopallidus]